MTSKLTREQLIEKLKRRIAVTEKYPHLEEAQIDSQIFKIALAAMDSEPVAWGNGCDKTVPAALRYLAENERPFGGESRFNAAHLYQLAREIELMAEAPLYRHAQQPVVPLPDVVSVLLNHLEDVLPDDAFNLIDVKAWNAVSMLTCPDACRAAMLQAGTLTNEGTIQAGNSPAIPDGSDVAALTGIPMIPEGYVMVPKEPTPEILAVITEAIRAMRGSAATYARVLAAAPQEVKGE